MGIYDKFTHTQWQHASKSGVFLFFCFFILRNLPPHWAFPNPNISFEIIKYLRTILLCFLGGTRKHNFYYSLFFGWLFITIIDSEKFIFRWVSVESFLGPPSSPPNAKRKLATEPSISSYLCSIFPFISEPWFSFGGAYLLETLLKFGHWADFSLHESSGLFPYLVPPFPDVHTHVTPK